MRKIAFFDAKSYDREVFDRLLEEEKWKEYEISYFKNRLNEKTVRYAKGYDAICCFVNDKLNEVVIDELKNMGIPIVALRCAGFSNVEIEYAENKIVVVRVPAYSPHSIAEFTMGLLLNINRKIHKAYGRTRDFNFSIVKLTGTDLYNKTVGVIGTGKIGKAFIEICKGFGMNIIAYDAFPDEKYAKEMGVQYVDLNSIFVESDVISLHCPLTEETYHLLNKEAFEKMKNGIFLVNTSRGALIDSEALVEALKQRKIGGVALDVYEEEARYFYHDMSQVEKRDEVLALLLSFPNVLITSHQAYLTKEALETIAKTTMENFEAYFNGRYLEYEVKK